MILMKNFTNQAGATAIEYAIIVTVIALVVVGGSALVGNSVNNKFTSISSELNK